jgi:uncharacterized protein DUF742
VSIPGRGEPDSGSGWFRPRPGNGAPQSGGAAPRDNVARRTGGRGQGPAQGAPVSAWAAETGGGSLVRPYAVTRGRTRPRQQLEIEAMVAAAHYEARDLSVLSPECQAILGFCRDWRSVAEISAVLRLPLGVVRVLIADMAEDGLVRIHQLDHSQGRPDLNLLERVLSGLRKL